MDVAGDYRTVRNNQVFFARFMRLAQPGTNWERMSEMPWMISAGVICLWIIMQAGYDGSRGQNTGRWLSHTASRLPVSWNDAVSKIMQGYYSIWTHLL